MTAACARIVAPAALLLALSGLAGCVTTPEGPRVAVMPPPGKPFDLFAAEDRECRGYAAQSIGQSPNAAGAQNLVGAAALGTALGAAAGAIVGGHGAAATGAAWGLAGGTAYGSGAAGQAHADAQRRYDIAYEQCMYAKGNQVPSVASYGQPWPVAASGSPSGAYPPAGYPPPPDR
jgi:hypothetical protein